MATEFRDEVIGYYYLHTNGELIYKTDMGDTWEDLMESTFVKAIWPLNPFEREMAWTIAVEALAAGAIPARVAELAEKWKLTDQDAKRYVERVNAVLQRDGDMWCATRQDFEDLQASPAGFGKTALEALAQLAIALGYKPGKGFARSDFKRLLQ